MSETAQQRYSKLYNSLSFDNQLIHVGLLLKRAANSWPEKTYVICNDEKISYKELYYRSTYLAKQLQSYGVKKNDRVIILWENSIEFYIAYFATWHIGAIVAPLNVFLTEYEVTHIIEDAEPSLILVSETQRDKIKSNKKSVPIISEINRKTKVSLDHEIPVVDRNLDDTAAILYTSGTTGFPKGVMLSSRNIIVNTIQGISHLEFSSEDSVFCALPLFHSLPQNTCLWSTAVIGATAIISPKIARKNLIEGLKYQPTVIVAVPALYGLFCKMRDIDFPNVRYFFSGGDALSDKIRSYFSLIYRRKLCNGYGLTETSPFICVDTDDYIQQTNTVGKSFVGIKCSIRNDKNEELPQGSIGVLWVKGENVMQGYYKAPELTREVLKDGWFNTGDLAYVDENGKIVLAGREKDLIIHKGLNIYPQEIENILLSHPKVIHAGVIGIRENDEEFPIAFVASDEKKHEKLAEQLYELCKRNLAPYKIPTKFIIKKILPLTTTGKVDKKKLKEEYE